MIIFSVFFYLLQADFFIPFLPLLLPFESDTHFSQVPDVCQKGGKRFIVDKRKQRAKICIFMEFNFIYLILKFFMQLQPGKDLKSYLVKISQRVLSIQLFNCFRFKRIKSIHAAFSDVCSRQRSSCSGFVRKVPLDVYRIGAI